MDSEKRRELKEAYKQRHPEKGIVYYSCGDEVFVAVSQDVQADYNGTHFQLELGSWPNKEMQAAYKKDPDSFKWNVYKLLDYDDPSEDYSDDLQILLMDFMKDFPDAKAMRAGLKLR